MLRDLRVLGLRSPSFFLLVLSGRAPNAVRLALSAPGVACDIRTPHIVDFLDARASPLSQGQPWYRSRLIHLKPLSRRARLRLHLATTDQQPVDVDNGFYNECVGVPESSESTRADDSMLLMDLPCSALVGEWIDMMERIKLSLLLTKKRGVLGVTRSARSDTTRALELLRGTCDLPVLFPLDTMRQEMMVQAAFLGMRELLISFKKRGWAWHAYVCDAAVRGGHLDILQWLWAQGCPCYYNICSTAVRHGQLEILRWLRSKGLSCYSSLYYDAANFGHLEVLRWLRAQGCPWDENACFAAALGGHVHVLEWLETEGFPWTGSMCEAAKWSANPNALKWCRDHGCP